MQWRDAWKSVVEEDGELSVMIIGASRMHVWHASRLVSHGEVSPMFVSLSETLCLT